MFKSPLPTTFKEKVLDNVLESTKSFEQKNQKLLIKNIDTLKSNILQQFWNWKIICYEGNRIFTLLSIWLHHVYFHKCFLLRVRGIWTCRFSFSFCHYFSTWLYFSLFRYLFVYFGDFMGMNLRYGSILNGWKLGLISQ